MVDPAEAGPLPAGKGGSPDHAPLLSECSASPLSSVSSWSDGESRECGYAGLLDVGRSNSEKETA